MCANILPTPTPLATIPNVAMPVSLDTAITGALALLPRMILTIAAVSATDVPLA